MFRTRHFAASDIGLARDNNEDAYWASPKDGLWVVADGMGGHAAGEVASSIVINTIERETASGNSLEVAIQKSHHEILNAANSGVGGLGMGSTVVALRTEGKQYEICWVGDSRAYIFSPKLNASEIPEFRQLTTDHSYVQMLYQSGAISKKELETHPEKNIITQCLGSVELPEVKVDRIVGEWIEDSTILLCSDGLSDVVKAQTMRDILSKNASIARKSNLLIEAALDAGGKDNITLSIIESPTASEIWFRNILKKLGL